MSENATLIPTEECIKLLSSNDYDPRIRKCLFYNAHQLLSVGGNVEDHVVNDLVDKYALPLQRRLDELEAKEWNFESREWRDPLRKPFRRVFSVERAFKRFISTCLYHRGDKKEGQANIPEEQRAQLVELVLAISKDQLQVPVSQNVDTLDILQRIILASLQTVSLENFVYRPSECITFAEIFHRVGLKSVSVGRNAEEINLYLKSVNVPDYVPEVRQLADVEVPPNMDWLIHLERFI